jgi:hypothetical protein
MHCLLCARFDAAYTQKEIAINHYSLAKVAEVRVADADYCVKLSFIKLTLHILAERLFIYFIKFYR